MMSLVRSSIDTRCSALPPTLLLPRQVYDSHHDPQETDNADGNRAQAQAARILLLRQHVADRRSEWTSKDVGKPERENLGDHPDAIAEVDQGDRGCEHEGGERITERESLGEEITRGGAERECEENRRPVEQLSPERVDRVHGQRPLTHVPEYKHGDERSQEYERRRREADSQIVDEIVRDESADDADEHDHNPVDLRYVPFRSQLKGERNQE